jgi:hypothetical protein
MSDLQIAVENIINDLQSYNDAEKLLIIKTVFKIVKSKLYADNQPGAKEET